MYFKIWFQANIEKEVAKGLLEDKVGSLDNLKTEVEKWEKKFKVRPLCVRVSQIYGFRIILS